MNMQTIKFEDKGQDFLEWIVKDGVVVDCQPHQFRVWAGKKVKTDNNTVLIERDGAWIPVNYKADSIEDTDAEYVRGYNDAIQSYKNEDLFNSSKQYKFGFNVASHSKKSH